MPMVDDVSGNSIEPLSSTFRRRLGLAVAVLVLSLVGAAAALWPRERPGHVDPSEYSVLIVGPGTRPLATGVRGLGLMADTHAQTDRLSQLLTLAESHGHGYIALHPPSLYDFSTIDPDAPQVPQRAIMAVVRVADGNTTFGTLAPSVDASGPGAKLSALVVALFEQPYYAGLLESGIDREALDPVEQQPLYDMHEAAAIDQVRAILETQESFGKLEDGWTKARDEVRWALPTKRLGEPFASTQGFPLANGGVLLMVNEGHWRLKHRRGATLEHHASASLKYLSPEALAGDRPRSDAECDERFGVHVEGLIVNAAGDGVAVRRALDARPDAATARWRVDAWQLTDGPCPFESVGLPDRARDPRMMGPVSSDGMMLATGSSGHKPTLERTGGWDMPWSRAAAWIEPGLTARVANLVRRGSSVSGLALVEPDAVEPRAGFVSARALFGRENDDLRVSHVAVVDAQTLIVATASCNALEVSFPDPIRRSLVSVPARDDIPRRADVSRRRFRTRWLITPAEGTWECGGMSFDRSGGLVVLKESGSWRLREFGVSGRSTLLTSNDADVKDIIVAPDGKHAVAHVWVEMDGTAVLTSEWIELLGS